jgi:Galactosyltransferase
VIDGLWHKKLTCPNDPLIDLRIIKTDSFENDLPNNILQGASYSECLAVVVDRLPGNEVINNSKQYIKGGIFTPSFSWKDSPISQDILSISHLEYTEDPNMSLYIKQKKYFVSFLMPENGKKSVTFFARDLLLQNFGKVFYGCSKEDLAPYHFVMILIPIDSNEFYHCLLLVLSIQSVPIIPKDKNLNSLKSINGIWKDFDIFDFNKISKLVTDANFFQSELVEIFWHKRILQDQLLYRFNLPYETRLVTHACNKCDAYKNKRDIIFISITTTVKNKIARDVIRSTWLKVLSDSNRYDTSHEIQYKFFVGIPVNSTIAEVKEQLESESEDIVILEDHIDFYLNLAKKVMKTIKWIRANIKRLKFWIKSDDDVYVRPKPVLDILRNRIPSRFLWGELASLSVVVRDPKYPKEFASYETYKHSEYYPMYTRGFFMIMSFDVLYEIVKNERILVKDTEFDDVILGFCIYQLIVRKIIHIDPVLSDNFARYPQCSSGGSTITDHTWIVHHIKPNQIICMFTEDVNKDYYRVSEEMMVTPADSRVKGFPDICLCTTR